MSFTGQLGQLNSKLGNIELGTNLNSVSKTVTSTLSLSQFFSAGLNTDNILVFTQSFSCSHVFGRSITSTLVPIQSYSFNDSSQHTITSTLTITQTPTYMRTVYHEIVTSTLTITESNSENKFNVPNSTETLILTQSISIVKVSNQSIHQNIILTQNISKNLVLNRVITNTLSLTETLIGVDSRSISNTLIFTQTITVIKGKLIKQSISLAESITRLITYNRTQLALFSPYSIINLNGIYNKSITNTLTLTQSIVDNLVSGVVNTITFTQSIFVTKVNSVQNDLIFDQEISYNQIRNLSFIHRPLLTQTIHVNKIYYKTIIHGLGFEQILHKQKAYLRTTSNTLTLSQSNYRTGYARTITSTLNLTETISKGRYTNQFVFQFVPLQHAVIKTNILERSVISTLSYLNLYTLPLGIIVPTINVAKTQRYTTIIGRTKAIVLPNPEFGDGEGNTGKFSIRRGMAGKTYTYVKETESRKLTYTFNVGRSKAKELVDFVIENNSNLIQMTNWKGEIWYVYIISNPNDMVTQSRYASSCNPDVDREKVSMHLEFEGVKI